jgi:hypothetical protein
MYCLVTLRDWFLTTAEFKLLFGNCMWRLAVGTEVHAAAWYENPKDEK